MKNRVNKCLCSRFDARLVSVAHELVDEEEEHLRREEGFVLVGPVLHK